MINIKKLFLTGILICFSMTLFAENTDSQFRKAGETIFISTQIPISMETGKLVSNNLEEQVQTVLQNLQTQVVASGATMDDVVKLTVYMSDIDAAFPLVKKYIPLYFSPPYPARSPMGNISFPKQSGFQIGIDATVHVKSEVLKP